MSVLGKTLLHYEIVQKIGEGGMGVVYKARDTRLGRFAAVKTLHPEAMTNPERKQRFVQEAQAASALNHPNIVHIYDIATGDGVEFIAMEYVEGSTLDALIPRKGLRPGLALGYAIQLADALGKAHAAGIIHRDIKPGNIMVNSDGLLKVLDFGLAKLTERMAESDPEADTRTMPMQDASITEEGSLVGTVAYMSPEQADGKKIDARSDIFAFGAVLYEMVSGRRAFQADSKLSTLALILQTEPKPVSEVAEAVPPELERIIMRCLRKNPDRRFQHMSDLKAALLDLKEDSESGKTAERPVPRPRLWPVWIVAGAALLASAAGLAWWFKLPKAVAVIPAPVPLTFDSGVTYTPTISRDGRLLAYASDRGGGTNLDIWIQQMGGGQPVQLTRHEAPDIQPDFSPDGAQIAFHSTREGGGVYVIPTLGGEVERKVADRGTSPRFSPDGKWIAYHIVGPGGTGRGAKVFVVPSGGGQPRQLVPEFETVGPALWAPDGRGLLVGSFHPTKPPSERPWDWWVAPLDGGPPQRTGIYQRLWDQGVRITEPGDWAQEFFYVAGGPTVEFLNIWRVPLSSKTGLASGVPERITSGTSRNDSVRVSTSGVMVCAAWTVSINLWTLPVDANQAQVTGKLDRLTRNAGWGPENIFSADGRKLVYTSQSKGNPDIWVHDIDSGKSSVVLDRPQPEFPRKITADGAGVIYRAFENQKWAVNRVGLAGGMPQKLCEDCCLFDVSAGDQKILGCMSPKPPSGGGFLDLASGKMTELWKPPKYGLARFALSPDDRWVAIQANMPTGRGQLYVMPVRTGGPPAEEKDWVAITDGKSEDSSPVWSPDGRLLYFISERDGQPCVWARRFDPRTGQPAGEAFAVHHMHTPSLRIWFGTSIAVARDKIALRLGDNRSNIWMVKLP